jgi:hypothetical protein
MTCISPPELNDEQRSAFVDGTADADVIDHLKRCPHCADRAQRTARWQQNLKSRLRRAACPPSLEVGEYHLGLLSAAQAVAVARHIVECPPCALELKQLRGYLQAEAAADQIPADRSAGEVLKEYLGGLVNVLTGQVTGGLSPAVIGIRGSAREPIMIEAEDAHIILDVQPAAAGRATLIGQVASAESDRWIGSQIELWQGGQPARITIVDEVGTFGFDGVFAGETELLMIAPGGHVIHVPHVEIRY